MPQRRKSANTNDPRAEIDAALAHARRCTETGQLDKAERWAKVANTLSIAAGRIAALPPPPVEPGDDGAALLRDLQDRFNRLRMVEFEEESAELYAQEDARAEAEERALAGREGRAPRPFTPPADRPKLHPSLAVDCFKNKTPSPEEKGSVETGGRL